MSKDGAIAAIVAVITVCFSIGLGLQQWHEARLKLACVEKTGNPECKR